MPRNLCARLSRVRWPMLLMAAAAIASPASADVYPSKPIRIIVAATAGAPPDIISRIVAQELVRSEGWNVVVENKPGALATLGAAEALKYAPDGYTLFTAALRSAAAGALLPNLEFRFESAFEPVIKLAAAHHVLVVHPSVPAHSLSELIGLLKSQPDRFNYSSGGFGTPAHLAAEMFKLSAGVRATHVPYQALPLAIGDLLNGTNHFQFITPLPVVPLVASGKLRPLAVTAPTRVPLFKDVPTVGEAGLPELVIQDWYGFLVKRGTPADVINRLNAAVNKVLGTPRVREAIIKMAAEPGGGSADEFGAFFAAEVTRWNKVVRDGGIKVRH